MKMKVKQISVFEVEIERDKLLPSQRIRIEYDKDNLAEATLHIIQPQGIDFSCSLEPVRKTIAAYVDSMALEYANLDDEKSKD